MTFTIIVKEQDATREVELCQVGSNPEPIMQALRKKTLSVVLSGSRKVSTVPKYVSVRAVEHA